MSLKYGQFCPIAKAAEVVGERWTLLILRELLLGTTRFNDFQRALSQISPTLLTKRLNQLHEDGLLIKKEPEPRKTEYYPTAATRELAPVIMGLGEWGMKWARGKMTDEEMDVELLMYDFKRLIDRKNLPSGKIVLKFHFPDLDEFSLWWIVIDTDDSRELCLRNPGHDVDLSITGNVRSLVEVWTGDFTISKVVKEGRVRLAGNSVLIKTISTWFPKGLLAGIKRVEPEPKS
jgi:DNA-binding HxlR family transcriptional regulator